MAKLTRRMFLATTLAAGAARSIPVIAPRLAQRRVLTLVYDKSIGAMRAIDRIVP